jgi:hypothetical protein
MKLIRSKLASVDRAIRLNAQVSLFHNSDASLNIETEKELKQIKNDSVGAN